MDTQIKVVKYRNYTLYFDMEDWEFINNITGWTVDVDKDGYTTVKCKKEGYRNKILARVLLAVTAPYIIVDHRNGNTLDNRKENLRPATHQQSAANKSVHKDKKSKLPKGVYLVAKTNRFRAIITINYRSIYLGAFDTVEEAAARYLKAAENYHREFASHLSRCREDEKPRL